MIDLTGPDYGLRWPPELFVPEAQRVLDLGNPDAAAILLLDALRNGGEVLDVHHNALDALKALWIMPTCFVSNGPDALLVGKNKGSRRREPRYLRCRKARRQSDPGPVQPWLLRS